MQYLVRNHEFERLRIGDKDPGLAVFISRIIPGLGHAYQEQWALALFLREWELSSRHQTKCCCHL